MLSVLSLLIVLIVSILVTKVATVALTHTGLSRESARFQARSAFTGVGFTTSEAERVVSHPVRRRILMVLMLLGNAGIVTAVSSLILTFVRENDNEFSFFARIAAITVGITILWVLASSATVDRWLSRLIGWALKNWSHLDTRDYAGLLHLSGEYQVQELEVDASDWMAGRCLKDLKLADEGVLILGIQRQDGRYVGAPTKNTRIKQGDVLIIYGREETLKELDRRHAGAQGEQEHRQSVSRQKQRVSQQEQEEREAEDNAPRRSD